MNTLQTFQFHLEPDRDEPIFKRLAWQKVAVSIRDVLMQGIHPWFANERGAESHPSLTEAFLEHFNDDSAKVADLESLGYCNMMHPHCGHYYEQRARFERTLDAIRESVYFVDALTFPQLLEVAKQHLRACWNHSQARALTERAYPKFQEMRQFLKAKDKKLKLSGYEDIDRYDLGRVLSLEDFEGRETMLVSEALPSLNFRRCAWLDTVTDEQGRLRLVPEIACVTLTLPDSGLNVHVERRGEICRFRPDIGNDETKRNHADRFSRQWRTDHGRLCFTATLDQVSAMVAQDVALPSFPTLVYTYDHGAPKASAELPYRNIKTFCIGTFVDHRTNGETLKDILRAYGVSMTGSKDVLVRKIATLAVEQYGKRCQEMDAFFGGHRFVRISARVKSSEQFPLLNDASILRNLLLTMYAMKHLRGDAVLDVGHDNNTYTEEQLASALMMGKVGLTGTFLPVL